MLTDDPTVIRMNIVRLRDEQGLSTRGLATRAGIDSAALWRFLREGRVPRKPGWGISVMSLVRIARVFGVGLDVLADDGTAESAAVITPAATIHTAENREESAS